MPPPEPPHPSQPHLSQPQRGGGLGGRLTGAVCAAVTLWALAGGACLGAVVAVNVATALLGLAGIGFAGDFELTELLAAVAIMAFLPYAQLTGAHVAAEIFTQGAGPGYRRAAAVAAGVTGAAVALVLGWRMAAGLADMRSFGTQTAILGLPIWWAYAPGLVSMLLWAAAGVTAALSAALSPALAPAAQGAGDV